MAVTTLEAPLASIVTFGWSCVGTSTLSYRLHVSVGFTFSAAGGGDSLILFCSGLGRYPKFVCDNPPLVLAGAFGSVVASVTPRPFRRSFGEAAARFRRSYGAVFVYNIFVLASSSVFLFVFDILDSRLPVACMNF